MSRQNAARQHQPILATPPLIWAGSLEQARCAGDLHRLPWQQSSSDFRPRGCHYLHTCQGCDPVTRALYVFTQDTGPLVQRYIVSAAQWHKMLLLPDDAPTTDYIHILNEVG